MDTTVMENLYHQAANLINQIIPEEWIKVYLYAEVNEDLTQVFFYYYPDNEKEPIYSLDITKIFDINEDDFNDLRYELNDCFEELWREFKRQKQEVWTNLTFILNSNGELKIEYGYEDLSNENLYEQKVIWKYKHLGIRSEGEWEHRIIEEYLNSLGKTDSNK